MISLTSGNFEQEVEKSEKLVVVDFWAEWCGPCRMLAPIMDELEKDFPEVKFCKVCVDDESDLARAFNVQSIPFVALVKDNTFVDFSVGYVPKEKLANLIREYI